MDSNQEEIRQISSAIDELFEKVDRLRSKLDNLCKETGGCDQIKKRVGNANSKWKEYL